MKEIIIKDSPQQAYNLFVTTILFNLLNDLISKNIFSKEEMAMYLKLIEKIQNIIENMNNKDDLCK